MEKDFLYIEAKLSLVPTTLAEHMKAKDSLNRIKLEYNRLLKETIQNKEAAKELNKNA